jgi:hypothetical protein
MLALTKLIYLRAIMAYYFRIFSSFTKDVGLTIYMQISFKLSIIMLDANDIILDVPFFLILLHWSVIRFANGYHLFLNDTSCFSNLIYVPSFHNVVYYLLH